MFEAYFDESGKKDEHLLVVAGYVGTVEQWSRFIPEWEGALKRHGLDYFHAQEFRSNKSTHFKHLSQSDREDLVFRLAGAVRRRANFGIAVTVDEDEYKSLTSERLRSQWATPYTLCTQACAMMVANVASELGHIDEVNYIFEEGHANAAQALEHFRRIKTHPRWQREYRLGIYRLGEKKQVYPLQAADMLAYGTYEERARKRRCPRFCRSLYTRFDKPGMPHYQVHCNATIIKSLIGEIEHYYAERRALKSPHNEANKLIRLAQKMEVTGD